MTSTALKLYTAAIAVLCAAAIAWTINQSTAAASWRNEARAWQAAAQGTVQRDRAITVRYQRLATRYNRLVIDTRRSQRRLVARMQTVQTAPVSGAGSPLPAAAPAAVAAPLPAPSTPTTRTS